MNYLLDTNACVAILRNKPPSVRNHADKARLAGADLAISSIVLHELWYGNGNTPQTSFVESTWNDQDGATGGGVSAQFGVPTWQDDAAVPPSVSTGQPGRGLPDVAGNAGPSSCYMLVVDGAGTQVGGTSAAAPLYAGLIALLNANLGRSVGFINDLLYGLQGPEVFRDIADARDNSYAGAPGYTSAAGWDGCTGLGSIYGNALLAALG